MCSLKLCYLYNWRVVQNGKKPQKICLGTAFTEDYGLSYIYILNFLYNSIKFPPSFMFWSFLLISNLATCIIKFSVTDNFKYLNNYTLLFIVILVCIIFLGLFTSSVFGIIAHAIISDQWHTTQNAIFVRNSYDGVYLAPF